MQRILVIANETCPCPALLDAIADRAIAHDAHEIMLSTHPPGRSHWLERGFVERAERELDIPVEHLVSAYGAALV